MGANIRTLVTSPSFQHFESSFRFTIMALLREDRFNGGIVSSERR